MGWPAKSAGISRWPGERPGWDANGAERGRRRELEVNSSAPVRVLDKPHLSIGGCQMSFTPHVTRRTVVKLGPLGGHKVHKMVKFRPRGMVDKREMEQAQLFETADERGCTPMFGAAHRRESACIGGSLPSAVAPSQLRTRRIFVDGRRGHDRV